MKLILITVVAAAALYISGGWQKVSAMWRQLEVERASAELRELETRRDEMFAASYRPPAGCVRPKSSLVELECKNQQDQARAQFNARFAARVAEGWRPGKP